MGLHLPELMVCRAHNERRLCQRELSSKVIASVTGCHHVRPEGPQWCTDSFRSPSHQVHAGKQGTAFHEMPVPAIAAATALGNGQAKRIRKDISQDTVRYMNMSAEDKIYLSLDPA